MLDYRLTTDVFCLEHEGRYIAYAPLKGLVMLVNPAGANLLSELCRGDLNAVDENSLEVLSTLMDLGLVNGAPDELHRSGDGRFRPTETTLFLTGACNLRCVYCYASGGDRPRQMSWAVATAAIDFVAGNAKAIREAEFGLYFHGGGEPTVAWETLTRVREYARERAGALGLGCRTALATNGVLAARRLAWIIANIDDVNISIDGLGEIHDQLRPLHAGGPSFPAVWATIQALSKAGRPFGLRMTVTQGNLSNIPDAVEHFCRNASPKVIHIEPVFQCGRCAVEEVASPLADEFLAMFRVARQIGEQHDISIYYSGARYPQTTATFCQAAGGNFTVTPDGHVTACYEVSAADDPRAKTFFYGRFDEKAGVFVFDTDKLAQLMKLTVDNVPFCADCFCKYHCAGDCPAKRLTVYRNGLPDGQSERCRISQELTRDQILAALNRNSRTMQLLSREYARGGEARHG